MSRGKRSRELPSETELAVAIYATRWQAETWQEASDRRERFGLPMGGAQKEALLAARAALRLIRQRNGWKR